MTKQELYDNIREGCKRYGRYQTECSPNYSLIRSLIKEGKIKYVSHNVFGLYVYELGQDPNHYNDGVIDVRDIPEFCILVFTNVNGKTASVLYASNFFYPGELLHVYKTLWQDGWNMEDEKPGFVERFRQWVLATGAKPEDLED